MPLPSLFSYDVRYKGAHVGDMLTLDGPIGNRRFRLDTRGAIRSTSSGTAIELTLRLSNTHELVLIVQLAFVCIFMLIVGFPPVMVVAATISVVPKKFGPPESP
jgi:hypothetical protein